MVSSIRYPHVCKIFGKIPNGCTEPLDACLESGDRVIVKPINNIQGNLALVNEYICYKLCSKLEMPIPDAGITIIDNKTDIVNDEGIITVDNYGYGFYSKRIDKATIINRNIIPRITNKEDFYKIILFDHLVYNTDRNRGNILVTLGKNSKMYMIDHTHVFKNGCIWDRYCFDQGIDLEDFNDRDIIESNNNQYMYSLFWEHLNQDESVLFNLSETFKSKITSSDLNLFMSELPQEWGLSRENSDALIEYLLYRLAHIDDMCRIIAGR